MGEEYNVKQMAEKIRLIRDTATELVRISGSIQAVDRNVKRILASVKMLEMNIGDVVDIV